MFIQPLVNGEFPKTVIDAINKVNEREKVNFDRLYEFSEKEKELIKSTIKLLYTNRHHYISSFRLLYRFIKTIIFEIFRCVADTGKPQVLGCSP